MRDPVLKDHRSAQFPNPESEPGPVACNWHRYGSGMIRLEQVRGEMLERFERIDRRFAQSEQRLGRVDQRLAELGEQIESLRQALHQQLELLARITIDGGPGWDSGDDSRDEDPQDALGAEP
jgi:hypothetical protein